MRKLFRDMFGDLDPFGRFWMAVGLGTLVAAAAMSFDFGWGVSLKHAVFLGLLTVVAAFGPMAAEMLWRNGRKGPAIATAVICLPLLGIEFFSHAGYTAGLRGSNIETAVVQNARYDGAQDAVSEDKTNLAMWREQLSTLTAQNAWAPTVKAEAMRVELAHIKARIDKEKAGKRGRKAGCGKECERLQDQASKLEERIGIAERASDLTKRIEATQRVLDTKRDVAAKTEHKSSAVDHQNKFLIATVSLVANGGAEASKVQAMGAEQAVNLAMALAGTGLPAFALFIAGLFRRPEDDKAPEAKPVDMTAKFLSEIKNQYGKALPAT